MRSDLAEGPADRGPVGKRPFLHDLVAFAAAQELRAHAVVRIEPPGAPRADDRIVDPKRGAEPVGEGRHAGTAIDPPRVDEHVLDGAAFQHAAEVHFALGMPGHAFVVVRNDVEVPAADQTAIEVVLGRDLGRARGGRKGRDEIHTLQRTRAVVRYAEALAGAASSGSEGRPSSGSIQSQLIAPRKQMTQATPIPAGHPK